MTMTSEPSQPQRSTSEMHPARALKRLARARIGRVPLAGVVAALAVVALLTAAYGLGTPSAARLSGGSGTSTDQQSLRGPAMEPVPAATAAPSMAPVPEGKFIAGNGDTGTIVPDQAAPPVEQTQIVKTGSMSIEVTDVDKAVAQAQSTIVGLGGYVADSSRSGDGQSAVATVTYRLPVAKWDDALSAMHKLASKLVSEQTNATDVTSQVIDLDARLDNLKATESALQGIMARASAIPDVLAVEQQLSDVQGQIEQLTAQRDHLKDLAAMSTLAVTFMTPSETVTTQATQGWDLGAQIDQAVAALVHIGQGLATIAVWTVIVGVPIVVGLVLLLVLLWIVRRIAGRGRQAPETPAEA
jgi:hypothetical protein